MPRPERAPLIGETVHYYEHRLDREYGPIAAIVTYLAPRERRINHAGSVNRAVLGEAALRFVPDVPFNDGGAYAGCWWRWAEAVEQVNQSGT